MKKLIQFVIFSFLFMIFAIELKAQEPKSDLVTVCFKSSMHCQNCQETLTTYLKFEKGVKDLKVDLTSNTIKVIYKTGKNSPENLAKGIKKQGYEANQITEGQYKIFVEEAAKK